MDFDRYYRRLGIDRPSSDIAGLRRLQSAQMDAVTFENIDPLLGIVPDVSLEGIFDKIVGRGRGGYCFELNTLFGTALKDAGFEARRIMARVRNGAPQGANRSHLAWIVTLDGDEWLADTGFGGSGTSIPLPLASREVQPAPTGRYRFTEDAAAGELVLERETPDGWYSLFGFDRVPVRDADIEAANFVTARWEKAPFPSNLMLSRHTGEGRISMLNTALRIESGDGVTKRTIGSPQEMQAVLAGDFALPVDASLAAEIWRRLEDCGRVERLAG
ncbi:arylamine N-acetyltransferase [Oricola sp.]|uniref:arylamine N-acetyltransferase family protein n=1 Tax=Oricola sp. TaxID=1979950 RepID=UPI000C8B2308|nr:arylamine N-acetyltransferase [Ahrensia sp.]|tara:strand:+ start:9954 stop:10775 length:822 start_codon:yes stop_codon:yes gene_type:complete